MGINKEQIFKEIMTISWTEIQYACKTLCDQMACTDKCVARIWPIPRGGIIIAGLMLQYRPNWSISFGPVPQSGDIIVDDICDTGYTLKPYVDFGFRTLSI